MPSDKTPGQHQEVKVLGDSRSLAVPDTTFGATYPWHLLGFSLRGTWEGQGQLFEITGIILMGLKSLLWNPAMSFSGTLARSFLWEMRKGVLTPEPPSPTWSGGSIQDSFLCPRWAAQSLARGGQSGQVCWRTGMDKCNGSS